MTEEPRRGSQAYRKLIFELPFEIVNEFDKEAHRLAIPKIELFRRMWELWKSQKEK